MSKTSVKVARHLCLALVREEGLVVSGDAGPFRVNENFPRPQRYERPIDVHGVLVLRAEEVGAKGS